MGAVDTTYTFTATDTITSAKMNNIIDQTTITSDAIIGTTLDVASGKLKIRSAGITSNEMGAASVTQSALAPNVVGNGPAFRGFANTNQSHAAGEADHKVTLVEGFDTNNNFDNSRFTATIAGHYMLSASTWAIKNAGTTSFFGHSVISLNGARLALGSYLQYGSGDAIISTTSLCVYLGVGDYVELFCYLNTNGNGAYINGDPVGTQFSGFLARSA